MPQYCYRTKDNKIIERHYKMGRAPAFIMVDGEKARRCFKAEMAGVPAKSGWPIECWSSGVNAEDADKLRDYLKKKGVPTEVTPDGDPIYTSHAHRKKALKARGFVDRSGYD